VINISVMMGMGVSGACGAMGTHSCGTGDCVMGSPFTISLAFSQPFHCQNGWGNPQNKTSTQKRG